MSWKTAPGNSVLLALTLALAAPTGNAQPATEAAPAPRVEDLGKQRYRIGNIEIDKAAGRFTVPARVLRDEPPIEFLLAARGSYKDYETVLEADTTAIEFNLACILIGLDATGASTRFSEQGVPWQGDPVTISVSWEDEGKTVRVPAASLLTIGSPPEQVADGDWIYIESETLPDGQYLPESIGILVGLVQRGESVIEHRLGLGIGEYGSIGVDRELLPPVNSKITVHVAKPRPAAATPDA